ncbi:MAG: hypothetical protein K2I32_07015 [Alistipes sp.]|nr:hypothetical protein [Alistipes sp.]
MTEQKYRPENPQYLIPEEFSTFPRELSFGGETEEEAVKAAMEELIAEPTSSTVVRELDETEIVNVRGEYTDLLENVRPEEQQKLADLLSEKARIEEKIKAQKEVLQSITQHVNDCIQTIKAGTTSEELDAARSFRMAVDGHYLHYTYSGGRFVLAKVARIPAEDEGNIFTRQTANQQVFLQMFGADFSPEGNFEEMEVSTDMAEELIGRTLAADVVLPGTEDIIVRDKVLDEDALRLLLEKGVDLVFVYKSPEDVEAEA